MGVSCRRVRTALVGLTAALGLALPAALGLALPAAAAAATLPLPAASQYNTTPDCPVSATDTVCAWNVPVDLANLFTAVDYGQCPYWAAEKYPALVLDELTSDPLSSDWDGGTWLEHAQQEGLSTSSTPEAGDLAVWQSEPSDPAGHVAYVEAVDNGAIIVSQMDGESAAPFPAMQGSTEYIPASALAYFAQTYGLEFIDTGDTSGTPLSDVEQPAAAVTTPAPTVTTTTITTTTAPPVTTSAPRAPTARRKTVTTKKPATVRTPSAKRTSGRKRTARGKQVATRQAASRQRPTRR